MLNFQYSKMVDFKELFSNYFCWFCGRVDTQIIQNSPSTRFWANLWASQVVLWLKKKFSCQCRRCKRCRFVLGFTRGWLIAYCLKIAHYGYLTNKGWSHSGHIALVASCFFLKAISCFSLLVPVSQDYVTTRPRDPSDYMITRPQLRAEDKQRPPPFRAQFPIDRA